MNSGFKTKSEEIEWRRAKILELKSQGLDQREMAQVLHVSPATITFDLQHLSKEARETIREYTTEQLPLQLRTFMAATRNPNVALAVFDQSNPYDNVSVRGKVVEQVTGDTAEKHVDKTRTRISYGLRCSQLMPRR